MFDQRHFRITCKNPEIQTEITPLPAEEGISLYRVNVHLPRKMKPEPVAITWWEDMCNILHVWHPLAGSHHAMHQWFGSTKVRSCFHFGAPVISTIGDGGKNVQTVATSDPITPTLLEFWIDDLPQKNQVCYAVTFFDGICNEITDYEAVIRVDTRALPYYETLQEVYPWWKSCGWEIPAIPAAAEDALYSSWYNFHQAPDCTRLLNDLKIAAELGFKTVILDDGWQFPGPSCGDYRLCGAWEVSEDKFPNFKAFADEVHALGMKLIVWFGMPFIGTESPLFETFRDKYLYVETSILNAAILDPRYPEVREAIISNYRRFLVDYDIDGFKFDFIDAFMPNSITPPYDPAVMDCETAQEAVLRLMNDIEEGLGAIKSDLLYEYRQCYIGPAVNRYGNMLRVGDCAYEAHSNRIGIVDLRLLGYPVAVHADMLFWAPEESLKLCSRQLLNILFSVPQISVILADSTEEQKELVRAYLAYWTENRDLLLHGRFCPLFPEQNFSRITAESDDRVIAVLHADLPYTYDGRACDVFHNGQADGLVFENPTDQILEAEISLAFGADLLSRVTVQPHSLVRLPVPPTGLLRVR